MVLGVILVVVGMMLLANNVLQGIVLGLGTWLAFAGPGVVFLAMYFFHTRHLGFLIQGAILTGLGLLFAVERVQIMPDRMPQSAGLFFLFLGLPFLFVWYVHTRRLADGEDRRWPLYPGLLLTAVAVVFLVLEVALNLRHSKWIFLIRFWPVLLVLVGLYYVLRARGGRRRPAAGREQPPEQATPAR